MMHTLLDVLGVLAIGWLVVENLRLRGLLDNWRYTAQIQINETKRNGGDA